MSSVEGEEVGDTIANRDVETPDVVPGGDPKDSSPVIANEGVVATEPSAPQKEAEHPTPPPTTDSPDAPAEHERTGSPEPLLASPKDEEDEEEDNVATVVVNLSSTEQLDEEEPEKQPRRTSVEEKSKPNSNNIPAKEEPVLAEEKFEGKGSGGEDDEKAEEIKPKVKLSTMIKLFRYATAFDWLLMLLGTLASICHGAALPGFTIVFGRFINTFIFQEVTAALSNDTIDCSDPDPFMGLPPGDVLEFNFSMNSMTVTCLYTITNASNNFSTVLDFCTAGTIDCLDNNGFISEVNILVYIFIGIGVGVLLLAYFEISLFQMACERQVKKIRLAFYRAIMRQEIGWFDANPSGELASRIADDVDKIHGGIGDKLGLFIQWIATFIGGFVVAFVEGWELTLLLMVFAPLLVIAGGLMSKTTTTFTSQEQKQYARAGAAAEEVLSSIRTVVAFGGEAKECDRYDHCLKEARAIGAKKGSVIGWSIGFVFFLFFALDGVAFWFGGYLIEIGRINGGEVLTVFFAVLIGAFALGQAFPNLENFLVAAGASDVIFQIIDRKSLIDPSSTEGEQPETFDGTIELKDVCFNYPTRPDVTVMDGFNLKVDVGKTIALVGPSGCGKSTVVQLIQHFYDPAGGEVLVGGKDVRLLNTRWLRRNIGVVSQEPILFDTTIAKNILYGNEDATTEEMKAAAMNANAHDFITGLPDGYDTLVGEAGTQLSGGQKQRIAIARALVRDPKILLLDEATSALDTQSEAVVQQALDNARTGRTTIVIAHRLSTIQNADVIASVEGGKVVEQGTHSELMDKGGLYYELVTAQSYTADNEFSQITSPKRLLSHRGSRRKRHDSGSESDTPIEKQLSRQASLHKDVSKMDKKEKEKKEEEWDKEIPEVSLWRVIGKNAPEWWIIVLGLIAAFINGLTFPSFALFFGEVLEVFTLPPQEVLSNIHVWAALFIALGIISGIANFGKVICFTVSGENLTSRLRSLAFKAMLRQEIGWFDDERNSTGSLVTRLADDAAKVQGATGTRLGTLLETILSMLVALVIAFVYSWVLTLLVLVVAPLALVSSALEVKALAGHAVANKKSLEKAGKVAVDSISNVRTVASLGLEESFYVQFSTNVHIPYKKALFNCVVYGVTYAFSQGIIYFMYSIIFRFGAFQITLPDNNVAHSNFSNIIVVFFALVFGAAGAGQAGAFAPNYAKAKLSASRIFHLLDRTPVIDSYSGEGLKLDKVSGEVATTSVNFNYPSRPDVMVLQGLDIGVKSGETLALVGPSGCGKSTVVSLLERFYNPISGTLTLDDTNIADLNIAWLRRQIGIVSQEPVLFDRSVADNIRYGANFREVSSEEVIEAAKAANIHNFVNSLPQGYNTNVGAKGTQISGGQKQRIAIARALVRDPKILLLDEATSALDTESEKIVQEALDKARTGRTSIVIAHRLSTIYNSNCIVVISGGKAIEKGTHAELMALKGIYYKLNRFQVVEAGGPAAAAAE